jgi:hypothetical protein
MLQVLKSPLLGNTIYCDPFFVSLGTDLSTEKEYQERSKFPPSPPQYFGEDGKSYLCGISPPPPNQLCC